MNDAMREFLEEIVTTSRDPRAATTALGPTLAAWAQTAGDLLLNLGASPSPSLLRVLVVKEKDGRRCFDASTDALLHAAALRLLTEWLQAETIERPVEPIDVDALPDALIAALPPGSSTREHAEARLREYRDALAEYQLNAARYNEAVRAVRDGDGAVAWTYLQWRSWRDEGERVELVSCEDASEFLPLGAPIVVPDVAWCAAHAGIDKVSVIHAALARFIELDETLGISPGKPTTRAQAAAQFERVRHHVVTAGCPACRFTPVDLVDIEGPGGG